MSKINIYIPKTLKYIGFNLLNATRVTAQTQGISMAKSAIYDAVLPPVETFGISSEDMLKLVGYKKSTGINNLVIKAIDNTSSNTRNDNEWGNSAIIIEFDDVKIDVTKENKIVETALIGRAGSIKEYIQEKDYIIAITGTLRTDHPLKFPYEELKLLNKLLSLPTNFEISSVYTDIFDIKKVIMKSAKFNQSKWTYFNVMPFELTLASDIDYDFIMEDNEL